MRDDTKRQIEEAAAAFKSPTCLPSIRELWDDMTCEHERNNSTLGGIPEAVALGVWYLDCVNASIEAAKEAELDRLTEASVKARDAFSDWRQAHANPCPRRFHPAIPDDAAPPMTYLDFMEPADRAAWLAFWDEARKAGAAT